MQKFLAFVLSTMFFLCGFISSGECREFVFVINSSRSMSNSDPQRRVFESVAWSLANLPADDEASVISFNDEVSVLRPLTKISENPNKIFSANYSGQSNAGDAMLAAVDMLMPKFDIEKNIILITNGEISLRDSAQTLRSVEKFQDGLTQAKWANMSVYIFNLRYQGDPLNYHSYTELAREIPIPHNELMTAIRTVFHNDFHTPHLNLLSQGVSKEKISAKIPLTSFEKAKLFLVASNPGKSTLENSSAVKVMEGNFVKIYEIASSSENNLEFSADYPQGTGLTLDAEIDVEGSLQAEISKSIFSADTLEITPVYKNNPSEKIFADHFFENKPVRVEFNGKIFDASIHNGVISVELEGDEKIIYLQKVFFEDLGVNFIGENSAEVQPSDNNYLMWILAIGAISVILILSYFLRKKNIPELEEIEEVEVKPVQIEKIVEPKPEPKKISSPKKKIEEKLSKTKPVKEEKFSYEGKFLIYVTKTLREEDIEPREFNLFRVGRVKISLLEILQECGIAEYFQEVGGIVISPGRRGIYLKNDSECTILKRGTLIEKGKEVEIYFEDAINIATSDENSEMTLRYKSLKPS